MGAGWARRITQWSGCLVLVAGCATSPKTHVVASKTSPAPPQTVASRSPSLPVSPGAAGRADPLAKRYTASPASAFLPVNDPTPTQVAAYPRTPAPESPLGVPDDAPPSTVVASRDVDRRVRLEAAPRAAIPLVEDTSAEHLEIASRR